MGVSARTVTPECEDCEDDPEEEGEEEEVPEADIYQAGTCFENLVLWKQCLPAPIKLMISKALPSLEPERRHPLVAAPPPAHAPPRS